MDFSYGVVSLSSHRTKHYMGRRKITWDIDGKIIPFTRDNPRWWCTRCHLEAHKEMTHYQWGCPEAHCIWNWMVDLMKVASTMVVNLEVSTAQTIVGADLRNRCRGTPMKLWHIFHGLVNWHVWKVRCTWEEEGVIILATIVKICIWKDLREHIRIEWKALMQRCWSNALSIGEAHCILEANFGDSSTFFVYRR